MTMMIDDDDDDVVLRTVFRELDKVQLLALLGAGDVGGDERVHEGLEVGPPPLGETVADLPIGGLLALADPTDGGEALVEAGLETLDLLVLGAQVVAGQLEEGVGDLQHQDVRVVVLVADEDALAGAPHAVRVVMLLQPLQPRDHRRVLLGLRLLDAERVVGQRVQADGFRLVRVERERDDGRVGRLERRRGDRRHLERSGSCPLPFSFFFFPPLLDPSYSFLFISIPTWKENAVVFLNCVGGKVVRPRNLPKVKFKMVCSGAG